MPAPPGPDAMTFRSLIGDLRKYAERGGVYDNSVEEELQPIVNRTERDIADRLKIQGYLAPYTSKMKTTEPRIAKPENWRSTVSISFGSGPTGNYTKTLRARSYEYCRAMFPERGAPGEPQLYADYDLKHWLFAPAPDRDYNYEAVVWRLPPLLSDANQTNYLTELAPNLVLYKSLENLFSFLKDLNSAMYWQGRAGEMMQTQTEQDLKRMVDRAQTRSTS